MSELRKMATVAIYITIVSSAGIVLAEKWRIEREDGRTT